MAAEVVVLRNAPIEPAELKRLVDLFFEDMVKYVVDAVRERLRQLTVALIGDGEPLP